MTLRQQQEVRIAEITGREPDAVLEDEIRGWETYGNFASMKWQMEDEYVVYSQ